MARISHSFVILATFAVVAAVLPVLPASGQGMGYLRNFRDTHEKPDCAKGDPVVWLNEKQTIYYPDASKWYGKTPNGSWICMSGALKKNAQLTKTVPADYVAPVQPGAPAPAASAAGASAASPTPSATPIPAPSSQPHARGRALVLVA